ncbi:exonuclease SbcCD subunit D [Priestia filamentosa]|uniref:exonuclease SbcCD subunit D n=1 Tax=Priestia filamentosa TaxID=1402861 RepID=UPI00234A3A0A|nr:exonuclease SbcCD subunit D [Priestia filamentosa]WCM16438.1 exonuclease SbcCD subunit D [Priestia filamentosa]
MRILHTADWHLGRTLEGRSRLEEQEQFLAELVEVVKDQKIDAILMAGDVFDTVNPPATAEGMFYDSVAKLSQQGACPIITIAGNHDSPNRLSASSPLAGVQNIHLFGYPVNNIVKVPVGGEMLEVAALPYPSESRLNELLSENSDEKEIRNSYDARIQGIFSNLASQFTQGAVHMAMSHIHVAGGSASDSERPIEVGGAYTVAATSLPEEAQYVALGHLHRPQNVGRAKTLARYSGSPLAYSFSEAGYTKSLSIIDVVPYGKAELTEIPINSGKPLVRWKAKHGIQEIYQWFEEGKDANAWIDLEIHLTDALSMEEIHRLRKEHNGIIHIRPVFHYEETQSEEEKVKDIPIDEAFRRFYEQQTGGGTPDSRLMELFLSLVHEEEEE